MKDGNLFLTLLYSLSLFFPSFFIPLTFFSLHISGYWHSFEMLVINLSFKKPFQSEGEKKKEEKFASLHALSKYLYVLLLQPIKKIKEKK